MIDRFDNIGVACTDYATSVAWYESIGFTLEYSDEDGGASMVAGSARLYVFATDSSLAPVPRALDLVHNAPGIDHISFRVTDVDAAYRQLVEHGVEVEDPPTDQDWGSRTLTLLDPDGNRIYFLGPLGGRQQG